MVVATKGYSGERNDADGETNECIVMEEKTSERHSQKGPRSLLPEVSAVLENESVSVLINYYEGNAECYIFDESNDLLFSSSEYVFGNSSIDIPVSSLPSGIYILNVVIESHEYEGTFHIIEWKDILSILYCETNDFVLTYVEQYVN